MKKFMKLLFVWMLFTQSAASQQLTSWRGQDHSGVFSGEDMLKAWPETGPELIREYNNIGDGFGSPAITADRIYIMGAVDTVGYLFCFDLEGKPIWKTSYGPEWTRSYPGSRACPVVVDTLVYVCSGFGNLSCFDALSGKKRWSKDFKADFDGAYTLHGHAEAPAVYGGKVFLVAGGKKNNVVALNRFTGELIWSCAGAGERPGYSMPGLIRLRDRTLLVTFSAYHLMGIDADTGELLWTHAQDNIPPEKREPGAGDTHSNVIYHESGYIYYVAGDGNGAVKLELAADGSAVSEVWRNPEFDDYMGGFVKLGGVIYGGTTVQKQFIAVSASTGKKISAVQLGSGNTIAADGMIYYYSQSGSLHLIDPHDGAPEVVSRFRISRGDRQHFSQPVIDRGRLYLRRGSVLMVYDIEK